MPPALQPSWRRLERGSGRRRGGGGAWAGGRARGALGDPGDLAEDFVHEAHGPHVPRAAVLLRVVVAPAHRRACHRARPGLSIAQGEGSRHAPPPRAAGKRGSRQAPSQPSATHFVASHHWGVNENRIQLRIIVVRDDTRLWHCSDFTKPVDSRFVPGTTVEFSFPLRSGGSANSGCNREHSAHAGKV